MPIGIISNASAIAIGGILGALLGNRLPERIRTSLPVIFGFCSMAIGVSLIVQLGTLAPVVLSITVGTAIGELLRLEDAMSALAGKLQGAFEGVFQGKGSRDEQFIERFVSLLILFCTGSTGILGAMTEGMTGDSNILLAKAVLDVFTSLIFASTLGILVALISVPQFVIFILFYFLAEWIMPLTTGAMIGDFMACGGIICLALGFRLCEIRPVRVTNILPAMALVLPVSAAWTALFG